MTGKPAGPISVKPRHPSPDCNLYESSASGGHGMTTATEGLNPGSHPVQPAREDGIPPQDDHPRARQGTPGSESGTTHPLHRDQPPHHAPSPGEHREIPGRDPGLGHAGHRAVGAPRGDQDEGEEHHDGTRETGDPGRPAPAPGLLKHPAPVGDRSPQGQVRRRPRRDWRKSGCRSSPW